VASAAFSMSFTSGCACGLWLLRCGGMKGMGVGGSWVRSGEAIQAMGLFVHDLLLLWLRVDACVHL